MKDNSLTKMVKDIQKRYGLKVTSGYRTQEEQERLEQRSCHCGHQYYIQGGHLPGCPMRHLSR